MLVHACSRGFHAPVQLYQGNKVPKKIDRQSMLTRPPAHFGTGIFNQHLYCAECSCCPFQVLICWLARMQSQDELFVNMISMSQAGEGLVRASPEELADEGYTNPASDLNDMTHGANMGAGQRNIPYH